jgi:hypothetical protein
MNKFCLFSLFLPASSFHLLSCKNLYCISVANESFGRQTNLGDDQKKVKLGTINFQLAKFQLKERLQTKIFSTYTICFRLQTKKGYKQRCFGLQTQYVSGYKQRRATNKKSFQLQAQTHRLQMVFSKFVMA